MTWILFALGAVLCWGFYGVILHKGQVALGNPLRALLCVGVAYFLIGVLVPIAGLSSQGGLTGFGEGLPAIRQPRLQRATCLGVEGDFPVGVAFAGANDDPLWLALKAKRLALAREQGVPPYVIFHDSTLLEILNQRPATRDQMAQVSGVGQAKLARYGDEFLGVLKDFIS